MSPKKENERKENRRTSEINVVVKQHPLAYVIKFIIFNVIYFFLLGAAAGILNFLEIDPDFINSLTSTIIVVTVILEIIVAIYAFLQWKSIYYVIKDRSIVSKFGVFFTREKIFIPEDVLEIILEQGLLAKIFNYGTIIFKNKILDENVYMKNIRSPWKHLKICRQITREINKMDFPKMNM